MNMTIVSKEKIIAAYGRCKAAELVHDQAINATAQALGIPADVVRDVVEEKESADA